MEIMGETEIFKLLLGGSPGVAALGIVFWLVIKWLPEERASREKLTTEFTVTTRDTMTVFANEVKAARSDAAAERALDRVARDRLAGSVSDMAMTLASSGLRVVLPRPENPLPPVIICPPPPQS